MELQQQQRWKDIEEALRALHANFASSFEESETALFVEFLDHNELGLAYDHFCDALAKSKQPVSSEAFDAIRRIGTQMGLQPQSWEQLTRKRSG